MADVSEAVRQQADALMLSGESAMGLFPQKAMEVLRVVSLRMEDWCREEGQKETVPFDEISSSTTGRISEQICNSAAQMGVYSILQISYQLSPYFFQLQGNLCRFKFVIRKRIEPFVV